METISFANDELETNQKFSPSFFFPTTTTLFMRFSFYSSSFISNITIDTSITSDPYPNDVELFTFCTASLSYS
jgi:hypothetical protein